MITEWEGTQLERIARALERLSPPSPPPADLYAHDAYVWSPERQHLQPIEQPVLLPLAVLRHVESQANILLSNTERFVKGLPANHALLWGARGTGKSSLVKAVFRHIRDTHPGACALIEVPRHGIEHLESLLNQLNRTERRFLLFCDDWSFQAGESAYITIKSLLEGGISGRFSNVLLYATSNRRHLVPQEMIDNERSTAINPSEGIEEKTSLADRFGLWLGFHSCSQEEYLDIIDHYVAHFGLKAKTAELHEQALLWSLTRGGRSGRVAWQFIIDLAGKAGKHLAV